MPFIRGRYHINPTMGEALEAAREAEAALLALEQRAREQRANGSDPDSYGDGECDDGAEAAPGTGPVHRVEIEAAEVVPSHSGRAVRGFVAHVHRTGTVDNANAGTAHGGLTPAPETHVFSDHRDLVNFLSDELAKGQ